MKSLLYAISLPIAWMLSPESLVLLGNLAGGNGGYVYTSLVVAFVVSILCVSVIRHPALPSDHLTETEVMVQEIGPFATLALTLASRISVTLLVSTGLLVTAGFALNEIFFYWFPNFGFAFLLLAFVLVVNGMGKKWVLVLQCLLIGLVVIGIMVLIFSGIIKSDVMADGVVMMGEYPKLSLPLSVSGLLLFLGYDICASSRQQGTRIRLYLLLTAVLLVFAAWSMLSLHYIPRPKLTESTIPHLKLAKAILGQPGRLVMGGIIIAGAGATVNALFFYSTRILVQLSAQELFPSFFQGKWQSRTLCLAMAAAIGFLMMSGLAGEEQLETYLRGALLLWILQLSAHCFAASRYLQKQQVDFTVHGFIVSLLLLMSFLYLVLVDHQVMLLIGFCVLTLSGAVLFSFAWLKVGRRFLKRRYKT